MHKNRLVGLNFQINVLLQLGVSDWGWEEKGATNIHSMSINMSIQRLFVCVVSQSIYTMFRCFR